MGILDAPPRPFLSKLASGSYYFSAGQAATASSATLGTGTLRLAPFWIPNAVTLTRLGADVATVGEAGSKFRIGLFADNGSGLPGSLILDAGTINGDSATIQEITVSQALAPGLYWFGGAIQVVTTTQPTMRTGTPWAHVPLGVPATPAANTTILGYAQTGVTGALGNFSYSSALASNPPRIHFKVA
jgi:hypothetical protein